MSLTKTARTDGNRDFLVLMTARPGTRLPEGNKIELNFLEDSTKTTVTVINLQEADSSGTLIPVGLTLEVRVKANNIDNAIAKAAAVADGVLSFASLCSGVGLPVARVELAYDASPGITDREFIQFFHDLPMRISRKSVDPRTIIDLLNKAFEVTDLDVRGRLLRAITWCRKGSLTTDVLDKFTCYWIGLETLNPVLQAKLKVPDDPHHCPKCGHEWVGTPTVSGVRVYIQKQLSDVHEVYSRIRDLRINLMHGKRDLGTLVPEAKALEGSIWKALVEAIFFVLEASRPETSIRGGLSAQAPVLPAVEAVIHGSDPSRLGPPGEYPHFEPKSRTVLGDRTSEDKISFSLTGNFDTRVAEAVTITPIAFRLYGEEVSLRDVQGK